MEIFIKLPKGTTGRDLKFKLLAKKLRIDVRDEPLLAGYLGGEVKCADNGDFEWEARAPF